MTTKYDIFVTFKGNTFTGCVITEIKEPFVVEIKHTANSFVSFNYRIALYLYELPGIQIEQYQMSLQLNVINLSAVDSIYLKTKIVAVNLFCIKCKHKQWMKIVFNTSKICFSLFRYDRINHLTDRKINHFMLSKLFQSTLDWIN